MLVNNRITMAEVLDTVNFRDAELVAGAEGLAREVSWVHVLETWDDANMWVDGEELILCSAVGCKDPKDLLPFYRRLIEKRISGFCLQLYMYVDSVPREMIDLANEYNIPLIVFRRLVRFIDLSRDLIRVIIEYVNQEYILEKQRFDENYWMLEWLNGNVNQQQICYHLKMKQSELKKFHFFVVIVEYRRSEINYEWSESSYLSLARKLRSLFADQQFTFYPFFANGQLTGIVFDYGQNDSWKNRLKEVETEINKNLTHRDRKPKLFLACGKRSSGYQDIRRSHQTALGTLDICQKFDSDHFIYDDLNLYFILSLINDSNHMDQLNDFVLDQLRPLITFDTAHNGKLMSTLKKYYDCNGNKQITAQALDISRQSLYYRLDQIEDVLGCDPLDPDRRLMMELCFAFYEYFKKKQ